MATEKRLIDANALLERLANSSESWAKNLKAIRNWWPHAVGIKDNIVAAIKDMPTVDAVEVVHGKWLAMQVEGGDPFDGNSTYCFDVFQCSECGAHFDVSEAMNYCPNCGAKMDGDGNG